MNDTPHHPEHAARQGMDYGETEDVHQVHAAIQREKTLTDAKIADVLTYIRQEWGNQAGPVAPEGIAALRKEVAGHPTSFHEGDLKAVPEDAMLPGGDGNAPPKGDANAPAPQPKA